MYLYKCSYMIRTLNYITIIIIRYNGNSAYSAWKFNTKKVWYVWTLRHWWWNITKWHLNMNGCFWFRMWYLRQCSVLKLLWKFMVLVLWIISEMDGTSLTSSQSKDLLSMLRCILWMLFLMEWHSGSSDIVYVI